MTSLAEVEDGRVHHPGDRSGGGRLETRPPFHLEATVRVLQRRPDNPVEVWEDGRYRRVLPVAGGPALVEVANRGTLDDPDVRLSVLGRAPAQVADAALEAMLRRILGLDRDPIPFQRMAESERALRPTALALRGMRPPRFAGLFETFANVVPFQQLSLAAGFAILGRLVERFGGRLEHDGRRFHAFPEADTVADARLGRLRACGLSARKAEALRDLARVVASGDLREAELSEMPNAEALRRLETLPGIGPWSAGLVLLRGLGRTDVFPSGDVGAARRLGTLLRTRSPASLRRVVERFGDQRGYLYFCALGGSLLETELIHPAPRRSRSRRGRGAAVEGPGDEPAQLKRHAERVRKATMRRAPGWCSSPWSWRPEPSPIEAPEARGAVHSRGVRSHGAGAFQWPRRIP